MSRDDALVLVDYVFSRPLGQPKQELGGVMVTLALLAATESMEMAHCGEIELSRIMQPEVRDKIRAKQEAKSASGLYTALPGQPEAPPRSEMTSEEVGRLAARALRNPTSLTPEEIQALAGSCLTQRPDRESNA